ncbi:potassium channel family protein [Frondihabitans peucedani]|uniref:Potassium channel family protein n=1 Tax=Frondihabitans peucedani TaxID=598626 RepID=A0ABP8E4W9_9MICO
MNHARWRRITDWPLMAVSLVFLGAYSAEVIGDLSDRASRGLEYVIWATWVVFAVDYLVNFALAHNRWRWFVRHLPELLVVALPILRPLRLLRLLTLLAILQRTAGRTFRGRVVTYVVGSAFLLVYVAALAVLDVERPAPGATITTFPVALWWAFVTISTVGYGDYTPVTLEGRMIAVALMLGGIALLGVVTATLASWIVERVALTEESSQAATRGDVHALARQIAELKTQLAAHTAALEQKPAPPGSLGPVDNLEGSADEFRIIAG